MPDQLPPKEPKADEERHAHEPPSGLMRFTPGIAVLRGYQRAWLRFDVLAGITVAAYLIPQCMAYAEIAGLPPVVGLWAILPPMVLYAIFGSSRQLSVGPESTTAIMTATAIAPLAITDPAEYAAMAAVLALIVGAVCVLGYIAKLGFLANLLSRPILIGYMAGVAGIMIVGQLGKVTGIDIEADGFFAEFAEVFRELDTANTATMALAGFVLALLFALQHFFPKLPGPLIAVLVSVLVVKGFDLTAEGVSVVGTIPAGLPRPAIPSFSWSDVQTLAPAAVGIALVGYSDNVLTARAFAGRQGGTVDANQELLALGTSNLGNGVMQGFPISSSGSRTVIGDSLGSKSQVYSLVAFASVILVILFLRPLLEDFPNAALGALVIFAAIKLIEVPEFRSLARFRRTELGIALATTAGVLLTDILIGVVIAIGLSVVDLLARIARPHDAVLGRVPQRAGWHDVEDWEGATTIDGLVIYRYDAPLFFANIDDFRESALAELDDFPDARWFLVQAEAIGRIDSTAADGLTQLVKEIHHRGLVFALAETKTDLHEQLDRAGLTALIGEEHLYATIDEAVTAFHASSADSATD